MGEVLPGKRKEVPSTSSDTCKRPASAAPFADKPWRAGTTPAGSAVPVELEVRAAAGRGNSVVALKVLEPGWTWADHPICVASGGTRRLPEADNPDELMQELAEGAAAGQRRCAQLIEGEWRMSHVQRHLDMQETTDDDLPEWARRLKWTPEQYNALAATLQSNVARHAEGGGLILNPVIRLCNHSCRPNTELCWDPSDNSAACPCGLGHYVVRALRPIRAGDELTYSYIGTGVLCGAEDAEERRSVLSRRWGFDCSCGLCVEQLARPSQGPSDSSES